MVFRARLKMTKMCLSEAISQLIVYFKLVSIQKYGHQSKLAFCDFHLLILRGFRLSATPTFYAATFYAGFGFKSGHFLRKRGDWRAGLGFKGGRPT